MPRAIRNAALAVFVAMLLAGAVMAAEQSAPTGPEAAPGMMQGSDSMPGMDGMMSMMGMMERMSAMMTLCDKMMGTTPSAPESDPS